MKDFSHHLKLIEDNQENHEIIFKMIEGETYFMSKEEVVPMAQQEQLYFFSNENEIIGIGIKQKSRIFDDIWSIGMLIKKEFRSKGLGTLLLIKLQEICLLEGKISMSGCACSNIASRKTIEKSSGNLNGNVVSVQF
eukprot:gene3591-6326_t